MKSQASVIKKEEEKDYYPSLFMNKDGSIIILANERTSEKTFSGMIIHSDGNTAKTVLGVYSTGWTYVQFKRMPKGSTANIILTQSIEE